MIVQNYLCNLKIFDKNGKYVEAQNQTSNPADFTLLGRTIKCSHRSCCTRVLFLKILQYPHDTPVLECIADLQTNKRDPCTGAFL